jgi:hypothetical protein
MLDFVIARRKYSSYTVNIMYNVVQSCWSFTRFSVTEASGVMASELSSQCRDFQLLSVLFTGIVS